MAINLNKVGDLPKIGWEDAPSEQTPIDSGNLKQMENNTDTTIKKVENNVQTAINDIINSSLPVMYIGSHRNNNRYSLSDNYKAINIPFHSGWGINRYSSYFQLSDGAIKILKPCEVRVHAALDFSRTNGGSKSSDYCFEITKNNVQLAEAVVGVEDNGYHHHVDVYREFFSVNTGDLIRLQCMASLGGTLNTFGDANKTKTYLSIEKLYDI